MKNLLNFMGAVLLIMITSLTVSATAGFSFVSTASTLTFVSSAPQLLGYQGVSELTGTLFVGLAKEIWTDQLMEGFYPETSWLSEAVDKSALVEYDKIHLAEAGVNPNVLFNNTTYPVPASERGDTPIELTLDYFDTENTILRNAEKVELSYDKRESVLYGHRQALMTKCAERAIYNYAPQADSEFTPVIETTGDALNGFKKLTYADVETLRNQFNEAEIPSEGRILVLNAKHESDLINEDRKLYNQMFPSGSQHYGNLYGFKVYVMSSKRFPRFNKTDGTKIPFGAAPDTAIDTICSVAFHKMEVMRCDGTAKMFDDTDSPTERGDVLGFQKRFLALPLRNKAISAIYSAAA